MNIVDFQMGIINVDASLCNLAGRGMRQAERGAEE